LTFSNEAAGKSSKAVQAIGLDGKVVHSVDISCQVRGNVPRRAGAQGQEPPGLFIEFYDKNRARIAYDGIELWPAKADWKQEKLRVKVPRTAMLGVIRIGLGHALGEMSFDDIQLRAADAKP